MRASDTRRRCLVEAMAVVALSLGAATALAAAGAGAGDRHPSLGQAMAHGPQGPRLALSGRVEGLRPGVPQPLRVRAANRTKRTLWLRSAAARVHDASPACPGLLLTVRPYRGRLKLRPREVRTLALPTVLGAEAPDACQSAIFPLRFSARARKAGR